MDAKIKLYFLVGCGPVGSGLARRGKARYKKLMGKKRPIMNVMYLCIHTRIKKEVELDGMLSRSKLFEILGKVYHVPKAHLYSVLREMVFLELIECPSPNEIKVLTTSINLDEVSKIQEGLGFY